MNRVLAKTPLICTSVVIVSGIACYKQAVLKERHEGSRVYTAPI